MSSDGATGAAKLFLPPQDVLNQCIARIPLFGAATLLSAVSLGLKCWRASKGSSFRPWAREFWFYKTVEMRKGSYLIPNAILFWMIGGVGLFLGSKDSLSCAGGFLKLIPVSFIEQIFASSLWMADAIVTVLKSQGYAVSSWSSLLSCLAPASKSTFARAVSRETTSPTG